MYKKLMGCVRLAASLFVMFLPNSIQIMVYRFFFGYQIGKDVYIGFSLIRVEKLVVGDHVRIGHLCRFKNIPEVVIGSYCTIGNGNHFTTSPEFSDKRSLDQRKNRPRLVIGDYCGISHFHYFDIQDDFEIGRFTTIAGVKSIFFTHQIDLLESVQTTKPIRIGSYCMIGSNVSLTPGSGIPDYSVVGMGSVVRQSFDKPYVLIAGNPASVRKTLSAESKYFHRTDGFISSFTPSPFS